MDNENTGIRRTGSWLPFYCWIVGVMIIAALMWVLPKRYRGEPWENIIGFLLGALSIFLFLICPVWMLISAFRYWKTKDYVRAVIGTLIALAIFWMVLYGPLLDIGF